MQQGFKVAFYVCMRWIVSLIFSLTVGFHCVAFQFRSGDLLFVAEGRSSFSEAISSATSGADSLSLVHVGILWRCLDGELRVVEASPLHGVRSLGLGQFIEEAPKVNGHPEVVVKRITEPCDVDASVYRALTFLGQPYDWYYLPDNGMIYCSELVYEAFLDQSGTHLFKAQPMNFRASDGTMPSFWVELYNELGVDVPEGLPGTNPNALSRDKALEEVFRFFN